MLGPSLTVSHLALATICAALMIGLGFLARPGRATVLWSSIFVLAMANALGSIAAAGLDSVTLWLVSMGAILPAPALVWSGLRAARGARRTFVWVAPVIALAATGLLLFGMGSPGFHVLARTVVLACALVNVLVLIELLRRPERGRGAVLPLTLVSVLWIVLGVVGVVASALNITQNYELLTQSNSVAIQVYLVCALVSLLLITRVPAISTGGQNGASFRTLANDRLQRAEAAGERVWTLLDIRLDDADDLRSASGETGFATVSARFHSAVRSAFPAECDIAAVSESRALVLVARTPAAVRSSMRHLIDDLARIDPDAPLSIQLSASAGWADVDTVGYELDALLAAAEEHALGAIAEGGDRWSRA
jgi:hypothetical protein